MSKKPANRRETTPLSNTVALCEVCQRIVPTHNTTATTVVCYNCADEMYLDWDNEQAEGDN